MSLKGWLKRRKNRRLREIAQAVRNELSPDGWEKFLPPVVLRDTVYMLTESGAVYAMRYDDRDNMEQIIKIRSGR